LSQKLNGGARPASRDSHACTPCAALASARGPWPRGLTSEPLGRRGKERLRRIVSTGQRRTARISFRWTRPEGAVSQDASNHLRPLITCLWCRPNATALHIERSGRAPARQHTGEPGRQFGMRSEERSLQQPEPRQPRAVGSARVARHGSRRCRPRVRSIRSAGRRLAPRSVESPSDVVDF